MQRLTNGTHQQSVIIFLAGSELTSQSPDLSRIAQCGRPSKNIASNAAVVSPSFLENLGCTFFLHPSLAIFWGDYHRLRFLQNPTVDELQLGQTCLFERVQQWQIWRTNMAALATKICRLAVLKLCQTHFSRLSRFSKSSCKYTCTGELGLHDILDYWIEQFKSSGEGTGWVHTTFHVSVQHVVAEVMFMSCNNEVCLYLALTDSNFQGDKYLGRH
jgi:hypothetical protein